MCCLFRYLKLIAISVFAIHFLPFLDSAEAQDDPINRDLWLENGKDQTVKIWSAQQSQKTAHYIRSLPAHREVENELRKILNPKFSVGPLSKVKNESMAIQHFLSDSRIFTISQKSLAEDAVIAMKDYAGVESGSASPSDLILNIPNLLLPNQQWSALGLECLLVQNICILQVHDGSHYSYIELNFSLKKVSSAEFNLPTQSIIPPKFVYISQDQVLSFSLIQGIDNNQAYESVELHDRGFLSKSKIHQISSVYDFLFATSDMSATSRSNILNRYFSGFFNSTGGYSLFLPEYFKFPFKVKSIHFSDKDPNVQMSVSEFDSSENVTSIGFHQDQLISLDARRHSIIATDPGTGQKMSEALINTWSESNSVIVDGAVLTQASVGIVSKLYITRLENGVLEQFPVDDGDASLFSSYRVIRTGNRSHLAIITKESPVNPPLYYLLNTITNKLTPIWNMPPPNDEEEYDIQVHVATSADGTKVFYTVVSLKSVAQESKPTVLYGYGGFGNPVTLDYIDLYKPLWVDRGNRYVFAHLRGGNEFGSEWHLQATGINRHKVYEDAIAVAEDLIRNNLTSAEQLAITGHSNGGNLAAVVAVQRPDLFALSIPIAGVLDMTRYNLFTPGEMWVSEYGDPSDAEELDELIKYSPLHSIKDGKVYPTFLVLTAADDVRVDPMHSRKFAHALEQSGRIHFFESYNGGHKFYMGTFREDVIFRFSLIFTMLRTLEK